MIENDVKNEETGGNVKERIHRVNEYVTRIVNCGDNITFGRRFLDDVSPASSSSSSTSLCFLVERDDEDGSSGSSNDGERARSVRYRVRRNGNKVHHML